MKSKIMLLVFLAYSIAVGTSDFVFAETLFVGPGIPNGETITYTSRIGDKLMTVVESTVVKRDGEQEIYEITSRSKSLDRTIVLAKETMAILSVHTVRKFQDVTLDSLLTVTDEKLHFEKDEIKVADFSALMYVFRGLPFSELKKLKFGPHGEEGRKKFQFSLKCKKGEKIKFNQSTIECYKLELGMDAFWGSFVPKTNMWFSSSPPHYLVRYETRGGPFGSPRRLELVSYNVPE